MNPIEYIQGAPMVDPEKRKKQNTGRITTTYLRDVVRYCATYTDATGRVRCVRMRDVFNAQQMAFYGKLRMVKKQCYMNASNLVELGPIQAFGPLPRFKYVEGFTYEPGLLPIKHAFVKIGDKYIDPTFERALHIDVTKVEYVALVELEWSELAPIQEETGFYGEIYNYLWYKRQIGVINENTGPE